MKNINPQAVRLALIAIGAALLIFALYVADSPDNTFSSDFLGSDQQQKPSAYLTKSTFNIFSEEGKLSKLYVEKAFFFSNKDSISIEAPIFTSSETTSKIKLIADKGFYNPTEETLLLDGNVFARQINEGGPSWELTSDKLNVDYKLGTLSTAEEVKISNGIHSLQAIGFVGSFDQREIKLLSNVRGKYVYKK